MIHVDHRGMATCYLCAGSGRLECSVCGGLGELHVREVARTHDGRIRLAELAGPVVRHGGLPTWIMLLGREQRSSVETLARNECKRCGTYLLELEWVGTAYCSRRCCVDDHEHNWEYASSILRDADGR